MLCESKRISRGEKRIMQYLDSVHIPYKMQHSFDDLAYKKALKFDFAVIKDSNLELLIEFDGEQHFEPVDHYGGEPEFIQTKIRDNLKNNYCLQKKIKLLRIPYWEFDNIENILAKEVSGF